MDEAGIAGHLPSQDIRQLPSPAPGTEVMAAREVIRRDPPVKGGPRHAQPGNDLADGEVVIVVFRHGISSDSRSWFVEAVACGHTLPAGTSMASRTWEIYFK